MLTITDELEELVDRTVSIPTIPTLLIEINEVLLAEDGTTSDAAQIVARDPAIAAKVLRLVNSPFYGLRAPVTAIPMACSMVGLKTIRNIVLQATVLDRFADGPELAGFDAAALWDHSFKAATAARLLAGSLSMDVGMSRDDAYTGGLMHDIGKMVLLQNAPDEFARALRESRRRNVPLARAERDLLGFDHAHVAGVLAHRWKLPACLQVAITNHHSPGGSPREWAQGLLIQAANTIAHEMAAGSGGWIGDRLDADVMAQLGVDAETMEEIRAAVAATSAQVS
jgi:putative nucleotidyltransferase with HDIG domain